VMPPTMIVTFCSSAAFVAEACVPAAIAKAMAAILVAHPFNVVMCCCLRLSRSRGSGVYVNACEKL
jgi:hypothetical protein